MTTVNHVMIHLILLRRIFILNVIGLLPFLKKIKMLFSGFEMLVSQAYKDSDGLIKMWDRWQHYKI